MIAITPDHLLQLAQLFRAWAHETVLINHQQAEPVAGIEKLGRRGIVRTAIGVAAHFLQARDPKILQRIRQSHADAGMILVIVGAL